MLYGQFKLRDSIVRMKNLIKGIKDKDSEDIVDRYRPKLYGIILDFIIANEEMDFLIPFSMYHGNKNSASLILDKISSKRMKGEEFKREVKSIIDLIPEDYNYNYPSMYDLSYEIRSKITDIYEIKDVNIENIVSKINGNNKHTINVFQPNCNKGTTLMAVKNKIPNSVLYGTEVSDYYRREAKINLDRVAKGSLKGSKISNNAFDLLILNPEITYDITNIVTNAKRIEKEILTDCCKYLREDGTLILYIPYFRLDRNICLHLAKNYKNIQIRKTYNDIFSKYKLLAIVCQKKGRKELDAEEYNKLRGLKIEEIADVLEPIESITLPNGDTKIEFFRGSVLDFEEMDQLIEDTKCFDDFWEEQDKTSGITDSKQPLLPFNLGQIGLVLTSGCLDGVVEEEDNCCHLIKGRVCKKSDTEREVIDGKLEIKETISNKVEIKIVLPNGDLKTLA